MAEPSPNHVVLASMQESINAPPNEVWPFLSAVGIERIIIPGCTKLSVLQGYSKGAVRRIYFGDLIFDEKITECDPATYTFSYEVLEPSSSFAKGVHAKAQLSPLRDNRTQVTWWCRAAVIPEEHRESLEQQAAMLMKGQIDSLGG